MKNKRVLLIAVFILFTAYIQVWAITATGWLSKTFASAIQMDGRSIIQKR